MSIAKSVASSVLCALLALTAPVLSAADVQKTAAEASAQEYLLDWNNLHMGTLIHSKVYGQSPEETQRFAKLLEERVTAYDEMMSVHSDTPMNAVNRHAGEAVAVPREIADMSKKALLIAEMTGGAFEPTIGPIVNLWKIGFGGQKVPSDADIAKAVSAVNYKTVRIWNEKGQDYIRINPDQNLDMGAIAKGYIGTRLAEILKEAGMKRGVLDLGGNVVAVGEKADGSAWRIGIQHPAEARGGYFAVVSIKDESVITSGAYERYFEENGKRYSHILDPKTGRPAKTDISSVTIIDRDGAKADALCTALFAMGWERAASFLRQHPELKAVLMHADMTQVLVTHAAESVVTVPDPSVKLTVLDSSRK